MNRVLAWLVLLVGTCFVLSGCSPVTAPSVIVSADGMLPLWVFGADGHLYKPDNGSYSVYYGPAIASDPELVSHADRVLEAANDMTGGAIRFVRSLNSQAPIIFNIDAHSPYVENGEGIGWGVIRRVGYVTTGANIGTLSRSTFLSNVLLHEIGHFLFGENHSPEPDDIMNPGRSNYERLRFSINEYAIWQKMRQVPPGATP